MRTIVVSIILMILINLASAQNTFVKDKETLVKYCDSSMNLFSQSKYKESILLLNKYSQIDSLQINKMVKTTEDKFDDLINSYGQILSFEFIKEKSAKNILINRLYLMKFKNSCLKYSFILYNNGLGWTVIGFHYDSDLAECF